MCNTLMLPLLIGIRGDFPMESDMKQSLFHKKKCESGDEAMDFSNTQHNGRDQGCCAWTLEVTMTGKTRLIRRFNLYSTNQKKKKTYGDNIIWTGGILCLQQCAQTQHSRFGTSHPIYIGWNCLSRSTNYFPSHVLPSALASWIPFRNR